MHLTQLELSMSRVLPSHAMHLVGQRSQTSVWTLVPFLSYSATLALVDLNVVLPDTDHRAVRARNRGHTVVRATCELELVLVGEERPVELVLPVLGDVVAGVEGVVAGPLTACRTDAAARCPHVGAGTTEVPPVLGQVSKDRLDALGGPPRNTMSPVEPCMLVMTEPCLSQISHSVRRASVV